MAGGISGKRNGAIRSGRVDLPVVIPMLRGR
jgi:hypothetical protein